MDATCKVQNSIHVSSLVHKYVSSILGTYQTPGAFFFPQQLLSRLPHSFSEMLGRIRSDRSRVCHTHFAKRLAAAAATAVAVAALS